MTKNQQRRKRQKRNKKSNKEVAAEFSKVMGEMGGDQKKVLNNLLFSATRPSAQNPIVPKTILNMGSEDSQPRSLPETEVKNDHLLVKGINLCKNSQTGEWEVSQVETNHGSFGTGMDQNEQINQTLVRGFVKYLKNIFEDDIQTFINDEKKRK